jgi:hypothetical protein
MMNTPERITAPGLFTIKVYRYQITNPIKARQIKAIARVLGQFPQIVKQIF